MKKVIVFILATFLSTACSQDNIENPGAEKNGPLVKLKPVFDQARNKGLDLAGLNGCLSCHRIDRTVVGPPWQDVADRYKGNPNARALLIESVKNGGSGNWTKLTAGAPMPPNSPRVSDEHIEQLVDFILALAK